MAFFDAASLARIAAGADPVTKARRPAQAPTPAGSFPEQWAYVTSPALFNAVCCSRRAGKTVGARLRALYTMHTQPGARVHYVTLIRRNCRKFFWDPLLEDMDALGWQYEKRETEMILWAENGSWLQAVSCDDMHAVRSIKGDRTNLFIVDEAQENLDDVLRKLIDVAAMPMLTDTGGALDLLGTVPETEPTYFSEALDSPGWARHHWTMFDHDYPDPREVKWRRTQEMLEKRGLPVDVAESTGPAGELVLAPGPRCHPIVQREYFGRRVRDQSNYAYEYEPGRNDYDPREVNFDDGGPWRHTMGIDLGFSDADAVVVQAWRSDDPTMTLRVRFAWRRNHLDVLTLADVVQAAVRTYRPSVIVGDTGGHGAVKTLESLKSVIKVPIQVKPPDVMTSVALVNDDYRTGRLLHPTVDTETRRVVATVHTRTDWDDMRKARAVDLLTKGDPAELSKEVAMVGVTVDPRTKKRKINMAGFHSDLSEANRYAHHGARHWAAKAPKPKPTLTEQRIIANEKRRRAISDPW